MLVEPPKNLIQVLSLAAFFGSGDASQEQYPRSESISPTGRNREMSRTMHIAVAVLTLVLGACSPKIYGTVQLFDANMKPIPAAKESPQGTVVNMINTTTTLEKASHAVSTDGEGKFTSLKDAIVPGMYKVEASRIGYVTETQSVEVSRFSGKKIDFKLKKIAESKRKSIEGLKSDEDKIVNPGEVNIQPPSM
jgi:hypothetical protein